MYWLLAACVPILLMLGALGLARLERRVVLDCRPPVTATALRHRTEAIESIEVRSLTQSRITQSWDHLYPAQANRPIERALTGPNTDRMNADRIVAAEFHTAVQARPRPRPIRHTTPTWPVNPV